MAARVVLQSYLVIAQVCVAGALPGALQSPHHLSIVLSLQHPPLVITEELSAPAADHAAARYGSLS